jgi:hypothetical protein
MIMPADQSMRDDMSTEVLPALSQVQYGRRLSSLLRQLSADGTGRITIRDIVDTIGNRALGALIFAFSAPIALPIPVPGLSLILGIPLLLLTWQLMIGRRRPWLPAAILRQSFDRRDFARIVGGIVPWLERVEQVIGPRHLWVTEPIGERVIGSLAFAFSLAVFVPVPFGNMPPALGLALFALGLLERDGRVILVGGLIGTIGLLILLGIGYGLAASAALLVGL